MKRIVVTDKVKIWAKAYARKVLSELRPVDALKSLKAKLTDDDADYVESVISLLPGILELLPWDSDSFYRDNFAKYDRTVDLGRTCQLTDGSGKTVSQQLYMHIVNALQYPAVQQEVFPEYVNNLGIRSCVYCNAQYAVSSKKGKTDRSTPYRMTYTIDHWKPKNKYPYLAVAFYNLYPCCAPCNQSKSFYERDWMMYCQNGDNVNPFEFKVDNMSLVDYLTDWDAEKLKIEFVPKVYGEYSEYDKKFHISKLYNNFKSEVEEVIWRSRIYNPKMIEALKQSGVYQLKPDDVNRFIIGNYDREEDILKRPLAKLIQDIAKQIGLV